MGLAVGDSLSLTERTTRLARMLSAADVIIESGVALTQEIHDGPFETHTGHGLWSAWQGHYTYSLAGKSLLRIGLDPALERVCELERAGGAVQAAIAQGLPKTKLFHVPFRMEMSGFARHEPFEYAGPTAEIQLRCRPGARRIKLRRQPRQLGTQDR